MPVHRLCSSFRWNGNARAGTRVNRRTTCRAETPSSARSLDPCSEQGRAEQSAGFYTPVFLRCYVGVNLPGRNRASAGICATSPRPASEPHGDLFLDSFVPIQFAVAGGIRFQMAVIAVRLRRRPSLRQLHRLQPVGEGAVFVLGTFRVSVDHDREQPPLQVRTGPANRLPPSAQANRCFTSFKNDVVTYQWWADDHDPMGLYPSGLDLVHPALCLASASGRVRTREVEGRVLERHQATLPELLTSEPRARHVLAQLQLLVAVGPEYGHFGRREGGSRKIYATA